MLVADTTVAVRDPIFDAAGRSAAITNAWLDRALAYAMQIYFDFSGYTDMAIGLARIFGVRAAGEFQRALQAAGIAISGGAGT